MKTIKVRILCHEYYMKYNDMIYVEMYRHNIFDLNLIHGCQIYRNKTHINNTWKEIGRDLGYNLISEHIKVAELQNEETV